MTTYPFTQHLDRASLKNCKNRDLKESNDPRIVIKREKSGDYYEFTAFYTEELSKLKGQEGGICNDVTTKPTSYGCGLAKYLMKTCFMDDKILGANKKGYNPITDTKEKWEEEPNEMDEKADKYCETITYTHCAPEVDVHGNKTPVRACVSYMRGALEAKFHLLFVYKGPFAAMDILLLSQAELTFGGSDVYAEEFIKNHGAEWFFCKCKSSHVTECVGLVRS